MKATDRQTYRQIGGTDRKRAVLGHISRSFYRDIIKADSSIVENVDDLFFFPFYFLSVSFPFLLS